MAAAGPEATSMTNPTAINRYIARNSKTSSQDRSRNKLGSRRRIATPRFLSAADAAKGRPSNHAIWSRCHLYVTWAEVPVRFFYAPVAAVADQVTLLKRKDQDTVAILARELDGAERSTRTTSAGACKRCAKRWQTMSLLNTFELGRVSGSLSFSQRQSNNRGGSDALLLLALIGSFGMVEL